MLDGDQLNMAEINVISGANIVAFYILADLKLYGVVIFLLFRADCNHQPLKIAHRC